MRHIIEIGDNDGKSFKIRLDLATRNSADGSWLTLDKGFIKANGGIATPNEWNIFLLDDLGRWGIRLDNILTGFSSNDAGSGELRGGWTLLLTPGVISWNKV